MNSPFPNFTLEEVREFARQCHEGQFRRDGVTPYFNHCEKVASLLEDFDSKAIAYCHDLIEDGKATYDQIEEKFGEYLAGSVFILTHRQDENYFKYLKRIKESSISGNEVKVKIADIVANLSDSPSEEQVKKYYRALVILTREKYEEE